MLRKENFLEWHECQHLCIYKYESKTVINISEIDEAKMNFALPKLLTVLGTL